MPCRGTGRLISNLGGTQQTVTCPWCDGGGVRVPGIDAQAAAPEVEEAPAAPQPPADAEESKLPADSDSPS